MNPGEVWSLTGDHPGGTPLRLIISPALYNVAGFARVLTAQIGNHVGIPGSAFEPYRVDTRYGPVLADLLATVPRDWLDRRLGRLDPEQMTTVRAHLRFVIGATDSP